MEALTQPWYTDRMLEFLETAPDGAVVEVGIYQGGSLVALAKSGRQCYGYDTFAGLPAPTEKDNLLKGGEYACPEDMVRHNLRRYSNITLVPGEYPSSDSVRPCTALAFIDVDLHRSTLAALIHIWGLLVPGGRVYCHDAFWPGCLGATRAVLEFAARGVAPSVEPAPNGILFPHFEKPH